MSTRMPPRGRGPQKPPAKPAALGKDYKSPASAPTEQRKRFPFVIILVLIALVVVFIQVGTNGTTPANNPGATLNLGNKTAKPGSKASPGATAAQADITNLPVITEVMTSNSGAVTAEDGRYYDWIEVYNPTGQTINLAGFAISDNLKKPTKFVMPSYSLAPGKYTLIFASDMKSTKTEIHAPFKLKSSGSPLILVDPTGREIQSLSCPEMAADSSYARDMNDPRKWAVTEKSTPGFPNSNEGYAAYTETRRAVSPVNINEVMAGNTLTFKDGDGEYSDWVEIYNSSDKEMNLTGWGLSNRESEPKRWVLPAVKLAPKKYLLVFVSGKNHTDPEKELHTDFRLNGFKDTILLSNLRGQIVSQISINDLKADASFGAVPGTDRWEIYTHPTPGLPNNEESYNALQPKLYEKSAGDIVISEVMSNNVSTLEDQFKQFPDWVELHNRSGKDISLQGWGLTDKSNELGRWKFPNVTLKAGAYMTVFASGRNLTDSAAIAKKKLHTDFNLGGTGDILVLTNPDNQMADLCLVPALRNGITYGRLASDVVFTYLNNPSPGAANSAGYPCFTQDPVFSIVPGMYESDQKVTITSSDTSVKIYYTLNGDTPTKNSKLYTGAIDVKKSTAALGATVIRAIAFRDGYLPSNVSTSTYLIGQNIDLPILSISVNNDDMFNPTTGLYSKGPRAASKYPFTGANFWKRDDNSEVPAHIELLEPDGTIGISQDVGLQIAGQFSRGDVFKSLDLIARSEYGKSSMDYQIFPDQPYTSYNAIVSRPGGQDVKRTGMRDVLMSSLVRDTIPMDEAIGGPSVFTQNYRTVLEFVNGEFWGVTHLREKIDVQTLAHHYPGADETRIDLIDTTGAAKAGSNKDYKALIEYVKTHDLSNPENYKYVTDRMDIKSYINFFTLELCSGNTDYGNIRLWRSPNLDGKWHWIFYDFCWTFNTINRSDIDLNITSAKASANGALIRALLKNPDFKNKFLKQLAYNINVTFETNNVLQRIDNIAATMRPYMEAESKKWHDISFEGNNDTGAQGYGNWEGQVEQLRDYAKQHPERLKQQMKNYFHLTDAQMQEYFKN